MYKIIPNHPITGELANTVKRLSDNAFIPFDPANTDYQQFKIDVAEGATLLDADGNTMSPEQVDEFLKELP